MDRFAMSALIFSIGVGVATIFPPAFIIGIIFAVFNLVMGLRRQPHPDRERDHDDVPTDIIEPPSGNSGHVSSAGTYARAVENGTSPALDGRGRLR